MNITLLRLYPKTLILIFILMLAIAVEQTSLRDSVYYQLYDVFQWLKHSSWIGMLGTTFGSIYATVEAVHLLSMALLGGTVLVTDLRLLGILLKNTPSELICIETYPYFKVSLLLAIITGIFCAAGVADKLYDMRVFWMKMLSLILASCFAFFIKQPLLTSQPHTQISPWLLKLLALSSLTIWFTVAAAGRWIGFS
ncbi:MAG: hypothetical protein COC19_05535 [SAR86 cluster bacterium]|uniref:DUF6644 domain-containing protein n=1 Tax=SAR86 cluster bacterium TaxID=2030880 RepID=A0A2A4MLU3_9GAMM|nr:MAG: hypothetical protein COC19_05535 [SAR86 cluster bacterium]